METQTNAVEAAINEWSQVRSDADQVIALLDQGNCFQITREQYEAWAPLTPEYFHVYPAVFDNILKFVLVDGVTDQLLEINYNYVFTADYTNGIPYSTQTNYLGDTDITVNEGLERTFRWMMGKNKWVSVKVNTPNGVFQGFRLPFSDLEQLFSNTQGNSVYAVFGLKADGEVDLILWGDINKFTDPAMVADSALPIPPFGADNPEENYQLLVQS